jgi:hypothetical protein
LRWWNRIFLCFRLCLHRVVVLFAAFFFQLHYWLLYSVIPLNWISNFSNILHSS